MSIQALTKEQVSDLLTPIEGTADAVPRLTEWVEIAARHLAQFLSEPPPEKFREFEAERTDELKRVARDPARTLGQAAATEGGKAARSLLMQAADHLGADADTRTGAAQIGDLASGLLESRDHVRADWNLTAGEARLFDDIAECLHEVAPPAIRWLPSNDSVDGSGDENEPVAAIIFARAFIQQVVDRMVERLQERLPGVDKRLQMLLNKSDRGILDGLRTGRAWHNGWLKSDGRAVRDGWPKWRQVDLGDGKARASILE